MIRQTNMISGTLVGLRAVTGPKTKEERDYYDRILKAASDRNAAYRTSDKLPDGGPLEAEDRRKRDRRR